jgi:hypothetical protein
VGGIVVREAIVGGVGLLRTAAEKVGQQDSKEIWF